MSWRRAAGIGAGGAAGAALRWAVVTVAGGASGGIPWPVLGVNIAGSLVLGLVMATEPDHPRARVWLHDVGGIGFCGGLTTFSTFAVEVVELGRDGAGVEAVAYVVLSVVTTIAAVLAGAALGRHVDALATPLEEKP